MFVSFLLAYIFAVGAPYLEIYNKKKKKQNCKNLYIRIGQINITT